MSESADIARFYGTLDIKTLGGAGFASQQTTRVEPPWDLSAYDGVVIEVVEADGTCHYDSMSKGMMGIDSLMDVPH